MRSKAALVIILTAALLPSVVLSKQSGAQAEGWDGLSFEISSDQETYAPMQLVTLKMKLVNTSGEDLTLKGRASVWDERIRVFIAREGEEFREYIGPGWGLRHSILSRPTVLGRNQAYETEATVLYQLREKTAQPDPTQAHHVAAEKTGSGYVLGLPGVYQVKALLYDSEFRRSKESNVARITVREPAAEDLVVIELLRSNPAFGYFIESGESPYPLDDERTENLVAKLAEIAESHPSYSPAIKKSLAFFNSTKEKIKKQKAGKH